MVPRDECARKAALVAGACAGDGGIEVLVDDGADPSLVLGEAIDRT